MKMLTSDNNQGSFHPFEQFELYPRNIMFTHFRQGPAKLSLLEALDNISFVFTNGEDKNFWMFCVVLSQNSKEIYVSPANWDGSTMRGNRRGEFLSLAGEVFHFMRTDSLSIVAHKVSDGGKFYWGSLYGALILDSVHTVGEIIHELTKVTKIIWNPNLYWEWIWSCLADPPNCINFSDQED